MAYTPGYEYDVFLSYSQAVNHERWVTRFEEKLTARLCERLSNDVRVFRDSQSLHGNDALTPKLREAVTRSAVFVPVVSRNYLTRDWCLLECQMFRELSDVGGRIFPVRYDDVSPAEYQQVLGGDVLGYPFFGATEPGQAVSEFDIDSKEFKNSLLRLRDDIAQQIKRLCERPATPGTASRTEPDGKLATVLLAESPPSLAKQREELVGYLGGSQIEVLQPGAGFHAVDGFATRFDELVRRADLFVQLLGRSFLPHDDEDVHSWDRWQQQRAAAANKPVQRWFLKFDKEGHELDLTKLDDTHRKFVTLPGTWDCDFQKFKQLVAEDAHRRGHDRRQQRTVDEGERPLIVIRSDKSDRQFADEIGNTLKRLRCESIRVPDKEVQSLEDFAKDVTANGLLVVYRACPGRWVLKRLQELRSFLRTDLGRRWACGLWKDPLDDDDPLSCSLDGLLVIDPHDESTLQRFVTSLRQLGRLEVAP